MRQFVIVSILILIASPPALATTWHVPADAPTIQAGIDTAAAGDIVIVACGTYYEHDLIMKSGIHLLSETGVASCVTIDAQSLGKVFSDSVTMTSGTTTIEGFTIKGGQTSYGYDCDGAGAVCISFSPDFIRCAFSGNASLCAGGGVYCENSSPTFTECSFSGNSAGYEGGGVYCLTSSPTFTDCSFSDNTAGDGGGVYCDASSLVLTGCTFSGNSAAYGAGLYCDESSATLLDCDFLNNTGGALMAGGDGGGMRCWSSSPELNNCTFVENSAGDAAGMACHNGSNPILTGCVFLRNTASSAYGDSYGGGIDCHSSAPSFNNCTFAENEAEYGGGLSFRFSDGPVPALVNCTISDNSAVTSGGGIYCRDVSVSLERTIIAFSTQGEAVSCYDAGNDPGLTCCDVYGNAGGDWVDCIAGQLGASGNISEDPLFCGDTTYPDDPYTLGITSPCAVRNSPCGQLIGARPAGCAGAVATKRVTWGQVKVMYK